MSALNATKRDLAEFVSVLGADTKAVVKGASDNINKMLVQPQPASTGGESEGNSLKKNVVEQQAAAPYDRCQAELFAIQNSVETYLQNPPQGTYVDGIIQPPPLPNTHTFTFKEFTFEQVLHKWLIVS